MVPGAGPGADGPSEADSSGGGPGAGGGGARADDAEPDDAGPDDTGADDEEALATVEVSGRAGPGSPLGATLATAMVLALGAGAVAVNRRRFAAPPAAEGT